MTTEASSSEDKDADSTAAAPTAPPPPEPPTGLRRAWVEFWRVLPPAAIPNGRQKCAAIDALDDQFTAQSSSVARFILAETKDQADKKRAAHRTLETKATSIIGFATAVLGFAATFGNNALLKLMWFGWIPAFVPALLFESLAIIAGVMALASQTYLLPDAVLYNYPDALELDVNEARIAMAMTQTWAVYERCLDTGNRTRSVRLGVAQWAFVAGILYTITLAAGEVLVAHPKQIVAAPARHAKTVPGKQTIRTGPSKPRSTVSPRPTQRA